MRLPNHSISLIRRLVLSVVCSLWAVVSFSQLNFDFQEGKFLIKGKVVDLHEKTPIPMANIRVNGTGKGITCDNEGNFTMYVYKRDTLKFSSTGYIPKVIH